MMAEIQIINSLGCEGEGEGESEGGERGERGERGKRGHRGHDGHDGRDGATGPTGSTGATGATGPGGLPIIAAARVQGFTPGEGFLSNKGFLSFTRNGIGDYSLALVSPPPDNNCIVSLTLNTQLSVAVVVSAKVIGGIVHVSIFAPSTVTGADSNFYITVTDNR
jgi:hypothetical protein